MTGLGSDPAAADSRATTDCPKAQAIYERHGLPVSDKTEYWPGCPSPNQIRSRLRRTSVSVPELDGRTDSKIKRIEFR